MDVYGTDVKLSDLGVTDLDELLETDVFSNEDAENSCCAIEESNWLTSWLDEPALGSGSDAETPHIQTEHSYSMSSAESGSCPGMSHIIIKQEPDMESECFPSVSMSSLHSDCAPSSTIPQIIGCNTTTTTTTTRQQHHILSVKPEPGSNPMTYTVTKQPTILLSSSSSSSSSSCSTLSTRPSTLLRQDRTVLPRVTAIKSEPVDTSYDQIMTEALSPESLILPPTPPSSSSSDSEGGQSPNHSLTITGLLSPVSPLGGGKQFEVHRVTYPIITDHTKLPPTGPLLLSEEEKRTLITEGYPIPAKLPLTKAEEKSLKKIRRKIKNKISAQESRRKKKEYVDALEKRVETCSAENTELRKKVESLECNNRTLLMQLQRLQNLVGRATRPIKASSTQTGTCVMVLVLCFSLVLGPWTLNLADHKFSQASPSIFYTAQSSLGQETLDDKIMDAYTTPAKRGRVLMSVNEWEESPYDPWAMYGGSSHFASDGQHTKRTQRRWWRPAAMTRAMPRSARKSFRTSAPRPAAAASMSTLICPIMA